MSLSSGTDTALLYDTLEKLNSKKAHVKILGKSISFLSMGEGFASLIASFLLLYSFTPKDLAVLGHLQLDPFLSYSFSLRAS